MKKPTINKRLGEYNIVSGTFTEHNVEKLYGGRKGQLNWFELNAVLPLRGEQQVLKMLEDEVTKHKRTSFIVRLHQRYTTLRAQRERKELLERASQ